MNPKAILQKLAAKRRERAQIRQIAPLIDRDYYLAQNPDVAAAGIDPVLHYLREGWREGRDPAPEFSTAAYLAAHPEAETQNLNPLLHKLAQAAALPAYEPTADEIALARDAFDAGFYLAQNPDIARARLDPLLHYLRTGWREGRDPHPDFSTEGYLAINRDVAQGGQHPLLHYLQYGRAEGRLLPTPLEHRAGTMPGIAAIRDEFDAAFYLSQYPDVRESGADPVEHYWLTGWREGRDPTPEFSTRHYLESNPDLLTAALPMNPFWHYLVSGRAEGRAPRHPGGEGVERLRHMLPLEDEIAARPAKPAPDTLLSGAEIAALILKPGAAPDRLIFALGHDNYLRVSGGVQFCIHREQQVANDQGAAYLNLHPWRPLPRLAHDDDPLMGLVLNGAEIGVAPVSAAVMAARLIAPRLDDLRVVIHQLLGHLPEQVTRLIDATGRGEAWLWLHDYITLCPSPALLRNGVSFCGAPPVTSTECGLCRFGDERVSHLDRIRALFQAARIHVVAPSQVALDLWRRAGDLPAASETVLPHATLAGPDPVDAPEDAGDPHPITLGFAGIPLPHKGWPLFEDLLIRHRRDPRFRFVYFGVAEPSLLGAERVPVHVTADAPDAMIDSIAASGCDLILHWASCHETFSLSTYEAMAGGAFVVSNAGSGNVAAVVRRTGRGVVLADQDDLLAFLNDGRAARLAAASRASRAAGLPQRRMGAMIHDLWQGADPAPSEARR